MILAARGQLDKYCPKEYCDLLMFLKDQGMQLELQKELIVNMMNVSALMGDKEAANEFKKDYFKLVYPDVKDNKESLLEEAKRRLDTSDKIIKVRVDPSAKMSVAEANSRLRQNG